MSTNYQMSTTSAARAAYKKKLQDDAECMKEARKILRNEKIFKTIATLTTIVTIVAVVTIIFI